MTDWTPVSPGDPAWTPADVENSNTAAAESAAEAAASAAEAAASESAAADSAASATSSAASVATAVSDHAALTTTHGVEGDIVGTTDTQTMTNKTLTSPTITSPDVSGASTATARDQYVDVAGLQDGSYTWKVAGGTADAITATYAPALTALVDGQVCHVRATAANTTTTPTFSPNGITAHTIVKNGGTALIVGDIAGAGHELILRYDLTNTRWELLNPADRRGTLPTTADLLALFSANALLTDGTAFVTAGRDASGDGGGGTFYYDATDTTTADNGVTVRVDGQQRRWKMPFGIVPNQYQAGAKGGGGRAFDADCTNGSGVITSAKNLFVNAKIGMTAVCLDYGSANTGGRPDTVIDTITAASAGSITIGTNASRDLSNTEVYYGWPDDDAFDRLMDAAGTHLSAVTLIEDHHLFTRKKEWGGWYDRPSIIRTVGIPKLMFAIPNHTDNCLAVAGYDTWIADVGTPNEQGRRYYPVFLDYCEIHAGNTGLDALRVGPSTLSRIKAWVSNSYRIGFDVSVLEESPFWNWQEGNVFEFSGQGFGHHGLALRTVAAGAFSNNHKFRCLRLRGFGYNSKLLGADITATAATNEAGAAVYMYAGGSATAVDNGVIGCIFEQYEFDALRTTAVAYGSDTNPSAVLIVSAANSTLLEGASPGAGKYSNSFPHMKFGGGGTVEDTSSASDTRAGYIFYAQDGTVVNDWEIANFAYGGWAGTVAACNFQDQDGVLVRDPFSYPYDRLRYGGDIETIHDFRAPYFTTETCRAIAGRETLETSTAATFDVTLPFNIISDHRATDHIEYELTFSYWDYLPTYNSCYEAWRLVVMGTYDATNFTASPAFQIAAKNSGTAFFAITGIVYDRSTGEATVSVTPDANYAAAGRNAILYWTCRAIGGTVTPVAP